MEANGFISIKRKPDEFHSEQLIAANMLTNMHETKMNHFVHSQT